MLVSMLCCFASSCLAAVVLGHASERAATTTPLGDQVRTLVESERVMRERLAARVQRMRSDASSITASIVPCTGCPAPGSNSSISTSPQIAYTGTLPAAKTSLTAASILNFNDDLQNTGGAFNPATGHFKAPVSGLYGFSLTFFMNPGYWAAMRLVKNGDTLLLAKTGHYDHSTTHRQVNMATNYVMANISAGEDVWPEYVSGSSSRIWADGVTTFSAFLLHEI